MGISDKSKAKFLIALGIIAFLIIFVISLLDTFSTTYFELMLASVLMIHQSSKWLKILKEPEKDEKISLTQNNKGLRNFALFGVFGMVVCYFIGWLWLILFEIFFFTVLVVLSIKSIFEKR